MESLSKEIKQIILEAKHEWEIKIYEGKISLYDNGKATESDFSTSSIDWSEFEKREPEEIINAIK